MGKASKRMRRQNNRKQAEQQKRDAAEMEREMTQFFAAGKYESVLEKLAELIAAKDVKPEYLYAGACSYYELGDLERATQWVSNTLTYAPNHVDARILLARICMAQKREEDARSILEFLTEHDAADLTDAQRAAIRDIGGETIADAGEEGALKQDEKEEDTEEDTLALLQRLKKKDPAFEEEPAEPAEQQKIRDVLAQSVPLTEKVRILNAFAGASYMTGDASAALAFLKAALGIDESDAATIRNLAMAVAAQGDEEKALQIAAKLPMTDFVLLQAIQMAAKSRA